MQKTFDGSTAVEIAFDENTMTAKEVDGVLKVGAKGTIPEALPQTAGALKSGKMTTSGWAATENKELYNGKLSFAGYNYAPSNNGKILSPYNYTSKNALRDWSGTIIDGRSIEKCTIRTDNGGVQFVSLYWESGTPSHKSREIQIYNDGTVKAWTYADWSTTYDVTIVATFLSDYAYTISDADVTTNSDILMEITDANHIVPAPVESGKIKVISSTIPTQPIPYTYKVKQTNASGQFTLVNHYVPSIPESPTSLPVSYKKASGSLPTSGWSEGSYVTYWTGNNGASGANYYKKLFSDNNIYNDVINEIKLVATYSNYTTRLYNHGIKTIGKGTTSYPYITGYVFTGYETYDVNSAKLVITENGDVYGTGSYSAGSDNWVSWTMVGKYEIKQQFYTISDTAIKTNSTVSMYLNSSDEVRTYSKTDGSVVVEMDAVPTTAIPYTLQVVETSAEGAFEIVNSYVPTKTSDLQNDSGFITAADIGNALYPVGSIYMSVNNTNPSTFFGGTWEAWGAGKVPVGVDANDTDFATVEKTGGEKTHTLTESEIPAHRHTVEAIGTGTTQQELNAFSVDNQGAVNSYGTTNTAGGGQAHNNLQPYITCYMWKRIN